MTEPQTYLTCLQALLEQTERLRAAVETGNLEQLLACLEGRQEIMNRMDALPEGQRLPPEDCREEAIRLLQQVAQLDSELVPRVSEMLAEVRGELEKGNLTRATISAYRRSTAGNPAGSAARFVDKQK